MLFEPGTKLVMIGDSITDVDRVKPIGESAFDGLGKGYVNLVNGLISATYPESRIRIVNMGCGGNTVRDLKARWKTDVLDLKPDWLSIMIGINDVWRHFDTHLIPDACVPIDEYESTLDGLCSQTRSRLKGLVLLTPYFIEPNKNDAMRALMDQYGSVVRRMAEKHRALFVDTQAAFDAAMKTLHPMSLAGDRVHPGTVGHMIIARAFLDAVGYEWHRK